MRERRCADSKWACCDDSGVFIAQLASMSCHNLGVTWLGIEVVSLAECEDPDIDVVVVPGRRGALQKMLMEWHRRQRCSLGNCSNVLRQ